MSSFLCGRNKPRKVQSNDFAFFSLHEVGAGCVGWIPVCYRQEYTLGIPARSEGLRAQQPVTRSVSTPGRIHMTGPITDVEMESSI